MLEDERFSGYTFFIVYHDDIKLADYQTFVSRFADKKVNFVKTKTLTFIVDFIRARTILTDTAHLLPKFKCKNQRLFCLGYYTPFKDDYWYINQFSWRGKKEFFKLSNRVLDYYITTSDMSSRIISCDFLLLYSHLKSLGAPRNDIFYKKEQSIKDDLSNLLKIEIKKIILYTPTFRDYESVDKTIVNRSIFGDVNGEGVEENLNAFLEKNDTILIAKLHPLQERSVIKNNRYSNIVYYSDLSSSLNINLYRLLAVSDCLITDYTSTSFDYMHKALPIIYYFYDYDKYVETRNFSISPIFPLCGGDIAYTPEDLFNSIVSVLKGKDDFAYERDRIHKFVNRYCDGRDTERVVDFIFEKSGFEGHCSCS
jgi:CDP-glycerol glycerophosphotransferase